MMMLNRPTFVLQRRINQPLAAVERVLCDPSLLRAGVSLDLGIDHARVRLDRSFGVTFPPFGVDGASWTAPASVRTGRGHLIVRIELEINEWDANSAELVLRPCAPRPYRWSGRRIRRYFQFGHAAADTLTQLLGARAMAASAPRHGSRLPVRR
jgi:hypothetical protein